MQNFTLGFRFISSMNGLKYFLAYLLPIGTFIALYFHGWLSFFTVVEAFVAIPLIELMMKESPSNIESQRETQVSSTRFYDLLLYSIVPIHYALLLLFLYTVSYLQLSKFELIGITLSMGIQCGAIGINVAHELGHRKNKFERFLARLLLLSSLYLHFIVEHNRGHHTYVATPNDPATARKNEPIYTFWIRTIVFSFLSAWHIEKTQLAKRGISTWSLRSEMIQLILVQVLFLTLIYFSFGLIALISFMGAAFIGILLLEAVNYVEHYGLLRKEISAGKYERVQPWHSWNSDYPLGRIMLFELTRHSDHHYMASRKYQILRHLPESPQLPTGYPGSILLSLIPPIWFGVINPRLEKIKSD